DRVVAVFEIEPRDLPAPRFEVGEVGALVLETALRQHLGFRAIPVGRLPAPVGRAALERGLVPAGEMIGDIGRREPHAAGDELHRARFFAFLGAAAFVGFEALAAFAGFAALAGAGVLTGAATAGWAGSFAHILMSFAASFGPRPSSSCLMNTY